MEKRKYSTRTITLMAIQKMSSHEDGKLFTKRDVNDYISSNYDGSFNASTVDATIASYLVKAGLIMKAGTLARPAYQRPGIGLALYKLTEKGKKADPNDLPILSKKPKKEVVNEDPEPKKVEREDGSPTTEAEAISFAESFVIYLKSLQSTISQWEIKYEDSRTLHSTVVKNLRETIKDKERTIATLNGTITQLQSSIKALQKHSRNTEKGHDKELFNTPRFVKSGPQSGKY